MPSALLDLRPAVLDDAALVADLETAASPDEERDPLMLRFWWTHHSRTERFQRWVNTRDGSARIFLFAGHDVYPATGPRYGRVRLSIHPAEWSAELYGDAIALAEEWLRAEGADTAVVYARSDVTRNLSVLEAMGFVQVRGVRKWRLDLVANRDRLLEGAARARADMQRQGVELVTLDQIDSPDVRREMFRLDSEGTDDIPKTVPEPMPEFDEWERWWFENPAHRPDREWFARDGERLLGLSLIGYPPVRGIPWTSFTCTAREARGRGIARALKHATVEQAIALGARTIETANDSQNAPILHLNQEMGYELAMTLLELHHGL